MFNANLLGGHPICLFRSKRNNSFAFAAEWYIGELLKGCSKRRRASRDFALKRTVAANATVSTPE